MLVKKNRWSNYPLAPKTRGKPFGRPHGVTRPKRTRFLDQLLARQHIVK